MCSGLKQYSSGASIQHFNMKEKRKVERNKWHYMRKTDYHASHIATNGKKFT